MGEEPGGRYNGLYGNVREERAKKDNIRRNVRWRKQLNLTLSVMINLSVQ